MHEAGGSGVSWRFLAEPEPSWATSSGISPVWPWCDLSILSLSNLTSSRSRFAWISMSWLRSRNPHLDQFILAFGSRLFSSAIGFESLRFGIVWFFTFFCIYFTKKNLSEKFKMIIFSWFFYLLINYKKIFWFFTIISFFYNIIRCSCILRFWREISSFRSLKVIGLVYCSSQDIWRRIFDFLDIFGLE